MTTYDEKKVGGELILHLESFEYCTVGALVRNVKQATSGDDGVSDAVDDPVGLPLNLNSGVWELVQNANLSGVDGMIISGPALEALDPDDYSANKYLILAKAPAILNQDKFATTDPYGTTYTQATLRTRMEALNFVLRTCPTKTSTQTE